MRTIQDMIQGEVLCCMSAIVSTLAQGGPFIETRQKVKPLTLQSMTELCEQAAELCYPIADYEEAAIQAGWQAKAGTLQSAGLWHAIKNAAATDDDVTVWCESERDAWEEACRMDNLEPIDSEVYEHWAITEWFADKLIAAGEKVDKDFGNLCIWARTTTGQGIASDGVVERIYADMMKPVEA